MVLDARPQPLRHAVDGSLEAGIVEGDEAPALPAHQMVMMLPTRNHTFKARKSLPHGHTLDEPVLDEQVEHAVDASPPDPSSLGPQGVLDLDGAQSARLLGQEPDDPFPGAPAPKPRPGEDGVGMLSPVLSIISVGHAASLAPRRTE